MQGLDIDIERAVARKTELYVELAGDCRLGRQVFSRFWWELTASANCAGDTQVIECVMEIARAGKAKGLPLAIATGGNRAQVTKSLSAVGLLHGYFDAIVTANDVTHGKPHPETFLRAAELIGVEPKHCVGCAALRTALHSMRSRASQRSAAEPRLPALSAGTRMRRWAWRQSSAPAF